MEDTEKHLQLYDENEDKAQELAAEIIDVMNHLGKALNIIEKKGFSPETQRKMVQLAKQTYRLMLQDLPNLFRESLQEEIEASFKAGR